MKFFVSYYCGLLVLSFFLFSSRERRGPLLLTYICLLSIIHLPGAVNFLDETSGLAGRELTTLGFKATCIAVSAMILGAIAAWSSNGRGRNQKMRGFDNEIAHYQELNSDATHISKQGAIVVLIGILGNFLFTPLLGFIPSASSLSSATISFIIIGYWLIFINPISSLSTISQIILIFSIAILPVLSIILSGFLSFGINWLTAILVFKFLYSRPSTKIIVALAAPWLAWLGLSVGAAYFAERESIREAVWYESTDLSTRVDRVFKITESIRWYNLESPEAVRAIDARLNQNYLVGAGIERIENGYVQPLAGGSLKLWIFIPRALWRDKPEVGGGGTLASEITGFDFGAYTSVGVGQVLEFYANFRNYGLILGFLCLGFLLGRIDMIMFHALSRRDIASIIQYGLPGLALMQPGGNLSEILVSIVAAGIVGGISASLLRSRGWFLSKEIKPLGRHTGSSAK